MSIGGIFDAVGKGIAGAAKVAGRAAEEFQPELQSALLGNAGEVAADKRHDQSAQEEQQRELQADQLEKQLDAGRKYGTLTPEQQQGLVQQITSIYPKAQHAPKLMERLHRIAKGPSQDAQSAAPAAAAPQPGTVASAFPPQGTASADADLYAQAHPKKPGAANPKIDYLNRLAVESGAASFADMDSDKQAAALGKYESAATKQAVENVTTEALNQFTKDQYGKDFKQASSEEQLAAFKQVAQNKVATRETTGTSTDAFGVSTVHHSVSGPVGGGVKPPTAAVQPTAQGGAQPATSVGTILHKTAGGGKPATQSAPGTSNLDRVANREAFKAQIRAWGGSLTKTIDERNQVQTRLAAMKQALPAAKQGDGPAQVAVIASYIKSIVGGQGVRVTQTEWNQATQLAPWLQRVEAHFTPDGYFDSAKSPISPEQADSMLKLVEDKSTALNEEAARIEQDRPSVGRALTPSGVGGGGRGSSTTHFSEGADSWDIPADKVAAFKKKHPNAKAQ